MAGSAAQPEPGGGPADGAARAAGAPQFTGGDRRQIRLLIVGRDAALRRDAERALRARRVVITVADSPAAAESELGRRDFDAVILDAADCGGVDLAEHARDADHAARVIVVSKRPTVALGVRAMRAGAVDLLRKPVEPDEFAGAVERAASLADAVRHQRRRVDRLKRICRRLNSAREEVAQQVDVLCGDLATAYEDLAKQMDGGGLAAEYRTLIERELDVETLLRLTLEFLLDQLGPTNAAIFLPTGHCDYSLGAYVNYDLPKDTADVLLDHLADSLPQRFEDAGPIAEVRGAAELSERIDAQADWLGDSVMLVASCRHDEECLAVVALFRERRSPFDDDTTALIETVRHHFGERLASVIRIHNRHKPTDAWPGFDVDGHDEERSDEDDWPGGLAA